MGYNDQKDDSVGSTVENTEEKLVWPWAFHGERHCRMFIPFALLWAFIAMLAIAIAMAQRRPCSREELLEFSYGAGRGMIDLRIMI
jgi:hypothetical protein